MLRPSSLNCNYAMRHSDDSSVVYARLKLDKCSNECVVYDSVQRDCAYSLQDDQEIVSFECNVATPDFEDGQYTSDFVCHTADGGIRVYECTERRPIPKNKMRLLLCCEKYWKKRGAAEWTLVVRERFPTADGEEDGLLLLTFADNEEELAHLQKRYPLFPT